jgi:hypothetical protein
MSHLDPVPSMWAALLYRIKQSEERDRILRDWEDVVFGHVLREERGLGIAAVSEAIGVPREIISQHIWAG